MPKGPTSAKALRESILARRNDIPKAVPPKVINCNKTSLMGKLEQIHGDSIENLIWSDSITALSEKLDVSEFTVSYWRRKFPIGEHTIGKNKRKLPVPKSS